MSTDEPSYQTADVSGSEAMNSSEATAAIIEHLPEAVKANGGLGAYLDHCLGEYGDALEPVVATAFRTMRQKIKSDESASRAINNDLLRANELLDEMKPDLTPEQRGRIERVKDRVGEAMTELRWLR